MEPVEMGRNGENGHITPSSSKDTHVRQNNTAHEYSGTDNEDDVYVYDQPQAPDGGWGWVIVFACFVLQGMIDGLFSVFGVFFPEFLEYFGTSRGKTAIIGSLLSSLMMFLGPFVSILVGLIGCRKVAIIGGVFITLGMLLSVLAPTIDVLIVTFGLFGGIGLGFIFQPAVVCVGFWFDRKRAVAMGISSSGAGIGMLVLASFSGALLEYSDWKNSLIMIACVTMQCIVCGALLRPVPYEKSPKELDFSDYDKGTENQTGSNKIENYYTHQIGHKAANDKIFDDILAQERIRTISTNSCDRAIQKQGNKRIIEHRLDSKNVNNTSSSEYTSLKPLLHQKRHLQGEIYFSQQELPKHYTEHHIHTSNPLLRKDIFYSGSIRNISTQENNGSVHITSISSKLAHKDDHDVDNTKSTCCQKDYFTPMKQMMSLHILKDLSFIIIAIANALMQAGFVICVYFITDFGISLGIPPEIAAYGVSIYGIGTTIGRASAGAIATLPRVQPVYVTAVSLIISGVLAICTVLFCKTFVPLAICLGMLGLLLAPIIPLTSVMIVDYLGLDNLTNGHGMISLAKGVSSLFSAPLAGFLQDTTGSYTAPFCLTGVLFIIAGLLHFLLPFISRREH